MQSVVNSVVMNENTSIDEQSGVTVPLLCKAVDQGRPRRPRAFELLRLAPFSCIPSAVCGRISCHEEKPLDQSVQCCNPVDRTSDGLAASALYAWRVLFWLCLSHLQRCVTGRPTRRCVCGPCQTMYVRRGAVCPQLEPPRCCGSTQLAKCMDSERVPQRQMMETSSEKSKVLKLGAALSATSHHVFQKHG